MSTSDFKLDEDSLLTFQEESPLRPRNWAKKRKLIHTVTYSFTTFAVQFNSTIMSSEAFAIQMQAMFQISSMCTFLGTSLYILGVGLGPLVFAPVSEMYGRKIGVLVPFAMSALFTLGTAMSYDVLGIMVTRFFAGVCSGAPIVSAGGVLADMWDFRSRASALALYSCFVSAGASLGPIFSSLLIDATDGPNGWRRPLWFISLLELVIFLAMWCTLHETYEPVVLSRYAKRKRVETGSWNIHAKQEQWLFDLKEILSVHLIRPLAMLRTPIVFLMALYSSYVFALFYLFISNVAEAFTLQWGWEGTLATLPLIGLFLGIFSGCLINMCWAQKYAQLVEHSEAVPEKRLPIMMVFSWCMPIGTFIFGWTCRKSIHWFVPVLGVYLIGIGYIAVFQGAVNYLVDCFPRYSASAIAANTFLRSVVAAGFPLFATRLFQHLGVGWGASLVGFIALGMIPIPFYFHRNGARIRQNSPYARLIE